MEAITEGQPGHRGAVDTVLSLGSWVSGVLGTQSSPWGAGSLGCWGHSPLPGESGHWGAVDTVLSWGVRSLGCCVLSALPGESGHWGAVDTALSLARKQNPPTRLWAQGFRAAIGSNVSCSRISTAVSNSGYK